MKIWMDRYTFVGETKGAQIQIFPGNWIFIVTSNFKINDIFDSEDAQAIRRRCLEIEFKPWGIVHSIKLDLNQISK